jgi:hypothetical protein
MRTDILMLTGSSRASEVAKEKGSMADIHLPQVVVVGQYREHFSTLGKLWATGSDHRWSVLSISDATSCRKCNATTTSNLRVIA